MFNYFYDLPDEIINYIYSIRLKNSIIKINYIKVIKNMALMELTMKLKVHVTDDNYLQPYYCPYDKLLPFVINRCCKCNYNYYNKVIDKIFTMSLTGLGYCLHNNEYQNDENKTNFYKTKYACEKLLITNL